MGTTLTQGPCELAPAEVEAEAERSAAPTRGVPDANEEAEALGRFAGPGGSPIVRSGR